MVMGRETLPADGGYFFVVDTEHAVVVRKCDLSLVARIPVWALEPKHADRLASGGTHARPVGDGDLGSLGESASATAVAGALLDG